MITDFFTRLSCYPVVGIGTLKSWKQFVVLFFDRQDTINQAYLSVTWLEKKQGVDSLESDKGSQTKTTVKEKPSQAKMKFTDRCCSCVSFRLYHVALKSFTVGHQRNSILERSRQ